MAAGGAGAAVRVLGPVSIVDGDEATVLSGGPRRRALLAMLATDLGRPVPVDRLVDGLWHDPPATAVNRVQQQVTHLRHQLPDGLEVVWTGAGYRLDAPTDRVDLGRFDALVNEAAAAERQGLSEVAIDALERAVALWAGDPVEGVGDLPCAEHLRRALDERRGRAEDRLAALLQAHGRAPEAVSHLEPLVERRPYDEHRWALLVRALGASGRTADALEAYQRARRRLVEGLGVEPGPELRAAEHEVLTRGDRPPADPWAAFVGDPASADVVAVGAALGLFAPGSLVGRDVVVAELVDRSLGDRPAPERVSLMVAEAGAGKTHLVAEVAHRLAAAGVVTLYGRHSPERYLPYEAWAHVLSAALQQLPRGLADALPPAVREPLAQLVAGFAPGRAPASALEADPSARFRLFEAVADLIELVSEIAPVLVVLDDLQWAATSSVALTRAVLARGVPPRVRVLIAARPGAEDPAVRALLGELAPASTAVDLPGLDPVAARELLARGGVDCTAEEARRIAELSAGNPLVLQQFRSFDGTSFLDELRGIEPSERAAAMVDDGLAGMADDTLGALEAAALAGLDFSVEEVSAVTGRPVDEMIRALEPALGRRLVVDPGGPDDRLSFGHALYQSVLARRVSTPRRHRGHGALSDVAAAEGRAVAAAHHALEAGRRFDPAELHRRALAAADRLAADLDPDQELRLLDRLASDGRLASVLRDDERFGLDLRRARLRCVCGDWDGSREQYLAIADESRRLGAVDVLTRVALEIDDRGRSVRLVGPRLELLEEARRRFGDGGDPARRIELDAAWAGEVNQFGRGDAAVAGESLVAFADEVVARARTVG
ncbi:MAG: AAA family ATPase, partial [Acidimicrobiales bacterium]|nr:AAA family ATPase [Acidimicrobiales bacterium]